MVREGCPETIGDHRRIHQRLLACPDAASNGNMIESHREELNAIASSPL